MIDPNRLIASSSSFAGSAQEAAGNRAAQRSVPPANLVRTISAGEIALLLVRMSAGPKCAKGAGLMDLAAYLDRQIEAARKE
jgi:hypothetical protein